MADPTRGFGRDRVIFFFIPCTVMDLMLKVMYWGLKSRSPTLWIRYSSDVRILFIDYTTHCCNMTEILQNTDKESPVC